MCARSHTLQLRFGKVLAHNIATTSAQSALKPDRTLFIAVIPMDIDWQDVESHLLLAATKELRHFGDAHRTEEFYGFAIDCNSEYGSLLLCLNTQKHLHDCAVKYSVEPPNQDVFGQMLRKIDEKFGKDVFAELSNQPPRTREEYEQSLRWSLGDWLYQGFNSEEFDSAWKNFEDTICDALLEEEIPDGEGIDEDPLFKSPLQNQFLRSVCRVALQLESISAFDVLNRTDDFLVYVADHDEPDEDSWARLKSARREYGR